MPSYVKKANQIFAVATRVTTLTSTGAVAPGSNCFVTDTLIKATLTPAIETGDDIAIKGGDGNLHALARHPDMLKYMTLSLELSVQDPQLEALITGGTVLTDNTAALGAPTGLTATAQTTLGTLPAGTYAYTVSQYNQYGESTVEAQVTATTTGSTGTVVLSAVTLAATAIGARVYGRVAGNVQLLGTIPNIGSQATSATSGTGAVVSLAVTALTVAIPAGTTFQITGDTNSVKIVFTVTTTAGVGATALAVTASQSVTTTIAAAAIVPVFVDNNSVTPNGATPTSDTTGGPGVGTGVASMALGGGGNSTSVSLEFWMKRYYNGQWAQDWPYTRIVIPQVSGMHIQPRDMANANLASVYEGQAFENPNWGSGPFADWQFASTRVSQMAVCSAEMLPVAGTAPVLATN